MLENIRSPQDIKNMSVKELNTLAAEIRTKIIDTVSENGGHLGSNLGLVETTLVCHKLFDLPKDKLLFDVGHQCYTHKLLTGRFDRFHTLRQSGGISGFPNRFESEYDTLTAGHSGSSISAALGIAVANEIEQKDAYTVCIVGDGSFTNGMIYEALNNCNNKKLRLIILLNDNEMSISPNVGSLAKYLSKIRSSGKYYRFKRNFQRVLRRIPKIGEASIYFSRRIKNAAKSFFYKQPFFAALGVKYLGPVDGNDIERLQVVLEEAKKASVCTLVHITTKKGYGYKYAEDKPENYHSVGAFDPDEGVSHHGGNDYSSVFGKLLCEKAEKDRRICAITAAMRDGTGLRAFSEKFPHRFFDVGIAEEHAVAFSGGLAVSGMVPVCALYSTFAQRTYDQLIHDVALQKLHIVLALDRAGFVAGDGETHQGVFDCAFLSEIPGVEIYAPDSFEELDIALDRALLGDGISVLRYPRGSMTEYDRQAFVPFDEKSAPYFSVCDSFVDTFPQMAFVTYGKETAQVFEAARRLHEQGVSVRIVKLFRLFPVTDYCRMLVEAVGQAPQVIFAEEGMEAGGISRQIVSELALTHPAASHWHIRAVPPEFLPHGSYEALLKHCGLDSKSLIAYVSAFLHKDPVLHP